MKGGYQILDLSKAEVDSSAAISGALDAIKGFNGKVVEVITPDNSRVYAQFKLVDGSYIGSYVGADGAIYGVVVNGESSVTISKVDPVGDIEAIEQEINALSEGIENLTNSDGDGRVDELERNTCDYENVVDLTPYNSFANAYETTTSGYALAMTDTGASNAISVGNNQGGVFIEFFGSASGRVMNSVYIPKGMKICCIKNVGTGNICRFIPLKRGA